ncbi:MAG TPA: hypothetical protein VFL57_11850 [Bryobacteraceae bacterium]|nr:hypothetical protein [Bryobacteraceae bacterium]
MSAQATPPAKAKAAAPKPAPRTVRVPVAAEAPDGALKREQIAARVNGAGTRVTRLSGPADDIVLLLVFDLAGDLAVADAAKAAVSERVHALPANAYAGVMRANEGLRVALDPTGDREKIAGAVQNVPVGGKAAFLDSVAQASQVADAVTARSGVRTAVVYITDSFAGNYREDFTNPVINESDHRDLSRRFPEGLIREKITTIERSLATVQAPVFFVHLNHRTDRLSEAYQAGMMQIAAASGGVGVFCRSTVEVADAVSRVFDAALGRSLAWVQVPPKTAKNVVVELEAEGWQLNYRSRFVLR